MPPSRYVGIHLLLVPALVGALAMTLQYGSADLALARLFAGSGPTPFAWPSLPWLEVVGHQAARALPIAVGVAAVLAGLAAAAVPALKPWRPILLTLGAAMIVAPIVVNALKTLTTQQCPETMQVFGGSVDYLLNRDAPFWAGRGAPAGHCLPSGHAGGGYALLALYFAGWAAGRPSWRWAGLAIGIAAGFGFGIVRMLQGAHFASATVWSAAVDWTVCALIFMPLLCRRTKPPA